MGPKEKKMVAYHEVGHALVTALQKDAEPVQKITIVPRTMGALGYTMQVPEEEKFLMTKNELVAHLVTYMGGRAAEEIVFDSVTTGASNDIEQATKIARAMVTQYGMSEKFGLMGLVTIENQYLDGRASLNCGEETAAQIDQEVMKILKESYDEATRLLLENREILDKISQHLYEHETITGKEFMKIFRELKGIPEPEEKTEAEKAAEGFQAESAKSWEVKEEEILVNTLKEEDLPPEITGAKEDLSPENTRAKEEDLPKEQSLEVNTLEGEELPGELTALQREDRSSGDEAKSETEVELIPVMVNMPKVQETVSEEEAKPADVETKEELKPADVETKNEAKPAEAKKDPKPASLELSTPEELGFFPAKKGSGKKGKSVPVKGEASVQEKPQPEKKEEAEEDYLDQLLKELK